jgi:exodeoxyribonuclease VII small subunit
MSKNTDFATSLTELEKVVAELDSDVPIEKALVLFERGMKLSNECEKFLTAAEQKVEILKRSATGTVTIETFSLDVTENSTDD